MRITRTDPALWTKAPTTGLIFPVMAKRMEMKFRVMEKVMSGGNFRDSYLSIGLDLESVERDTDPVESLKKRTSTGTTGNLNIEFSINEERRLRKENDERMEHLVSVYERLPGLEELII